MTNLIEMGFVEKEKILLDREEYLWPQEIEKIIPAESCPIKISLECVESGIVEESYEIHSITGEIVRKA